MEPAEYDLMDAAEGRMWWYRALHARIIDALAGVTGRVLDAGCGTGGLLAMLAPSLHPVGLEFSDTAARRAADKSGAPVVCGSVNAMPFADASFDAAIAADVLCHVAVDLAAALIELRRVLRPGGRLVVNMPAFAWLMSAHDRRVHNARRQTAAELRAALHAAGFVRLRVGYWNGLLLPLMILERKLLARGESAGSDVAPVLPWLDAALHGITVLERRLPFPLPAGGSVLAIAEAP
jgi:SAM-dependent methyltransferase